MARGITADKLSGAQKAAVLLLNLGGELASKVLQTMDEEEIQNLGNYMASIGAVTPDVSKKVNEEFLFRTSGGASQGFSTGNVATVRKLLAEALGEEQAEAVVANLSVPTDEAGIETLRLLDP
ncbi:MAG: hypothetical protein V3V62_11845, partial [bacterium]